MKRTGIENADQIYWSFWFRFDDGGASGEQTKLFQLWGNGARECDYGPGVMSGGFADGWFASYNIASGTDCKTGDEAFLFVVDSSGQMSSGFRITIGEGNGDTPVPSPSFPPTPVNDFQLVLTQ